MPSINLAPGTQFIVEARRRRRRLFMLSGLIALGVLLIWSSLFLYNYSLAGRQAALAERIRNVQVEISKLDADAKRIVLFEERLKALDVLLNEHISWEVVWRDLERLLPGDVVLKRLEAGSETGGVSLTGLTLDIDKVALALASLIESTDHPSAFREGKLAEVRREENSNAESGVVSVQYLFSADLKFNPSLLKQNK